MYLEGVFIYLSSEPVSSIIINVTEHTLSLYLDNEFFKTYTVAVGKPSTQSPIGTFKIFNKSVNPGGPYGARWMGLSIPHYGIHGTNNPNSIGLDISHGCIRMYNDDIIELYSIASIGDIVEIIL